MNHQKPRFHTCDVCRKSEVWNENWAWYGNFDDSEILVCSAECKANADTSRGRPLKMPAEFRDIVGEYTADLVAAQTKAREWLAKHPHLVGRSGEDVLADFLAYHPSALRARERSA